MNVTNLFTGLLWDYSRNQPVDTIKKRKKRVLVTREKKNYLFNAVSFEYDLKQILGIDNILAQRHACSKLGIAYETELSFERHNVKNLIQNKVSKINCTFGDVGKQYITYEFPSKQTAKELVYGIPQTIERSGYWTNATRICKIQIIFRQSGEALIRGIPKKEDEFYLLVDRPKMANKWDIKYDIDGMGSIQSTYPANSSWIDLEYQWDNRELGKNCPIPEIVDWNDSNNNCPIFEDEDGSYSN